MARLSASQSKSQEIVEISAAMSERGGKLPDADPPKSSGGGGGEETLSPRKSKHCVIQISKPLRSVRDALGVGDIDFVSCSSTVYEAMVMDWMRNLEVGIPAMLEDGIKLLVYAGEYDLICNWLGNSRWVHAMEWSGQKKFAAAATTPFSVDGAEAGQQKGYGPLTFLKVHDAGHMVPMDQPKASVEMLRRWMQGKLTQADNHLAPM
ncbi:serine carboxypeptidase-like 48 [Salvia miltiorrhiza]|uniref:serine carboxypeptidase-like 48 n=1 Tax=Salvia miltiorrhiza TaxID=226208 RepID=UPI0025AD703D|nr:serine carboxypeptidase-like 48 [Salvia miltiorrhiza]